MRTVPILRIAAYAIMIAIGLGGCASIPRQAFNKDANHNLKTIEILEQVNTEKYFVHNMGHVGYGFGLAGGLVAATDMEIKTNNFTSLMKDRGFKAVDEFQQELRTTLENVGYTVRLLNVGRKKHELFETYNWLNGGGAAAYLDFKIGVGYICASVIADYIPAVHVTVRLIKHGSHKILYQEVIYYGYALSAKDAANFAADQQYYFKNFGTLSGNPDHALEGLRKGIAIAAKHIAQSLAI